jgi:ectoine hydroxylase-related dioxygenase (phytanoyl-CoA dioxygenase family)
MDPVRPTASHPTAGERFFFDNNGYLVLEDFLAPEHVAALIGAVERTIERRKSPDYKREHPTAFPDNLAGPNFRIFHLLDEDPLFLDLMDYGPMMEYVRGLFNPMPHNHATDVIYEVERAGYHGVGWHIDGIQDGFRHLKPHIPFLQFKIGYYLSDMSEPGQGNLTVVPASHKALVDPDPEDLRSPDLFPGAVQVCGGPGTAFFFHNALWHTGGPWTKADGKRIILYYSFEHPWMMACAEPWRYPQSFLNGLSPEQRKYFHGFLFEPKEYRWG